MLLVVVMVVAAAAAIVILTAAAAVVSVSLAHIAYEQRLMGLPGLVLLVDLVRPNDRVGDLEECWVDV